MPRRDNSAATKYSPATPAIREGIFMIDLGYAANPSRPANSSQNLGLFHDGLDRCRLKIRRVAVLPQDASGRTTGTATTRPTGSGSERTTLTDGKGRNSGSATTQTSSSSEQTTFRDSSGRTTGSATKRR